MKKNLGVKIILLLILGLIVGGIGKAAMDGAKRTQTIQPFAECLKSSGTSFYGTFWCPVCQKQKQLFAGAAKYLPYIECSNPDHSQNNTCNEIGIKKYPTWIFSDGSITTGLLSFEDLAKKTSCTSPSL